MDFSAVCKGGVQVFRVATGTPSQAPTTTDVAPALPQVKIQKVNQFPGSEGAKWSPSGTSIALTYGSRVDVVSGDNLNDPEPKKISLPSEVKHVLWSPRGTFLLICVGNSSGKDSAAHVWDVTQYREVAVFPLRSVAKQWPPLVWSGDEAFAFQTSPNVVRIFDSFSGEFTKPIGTLSVVDATYCIASPEVNEKTLALAVFATPPQAAPVPRGKSPPVAEQPKQTASKNTASSISIFDLSDLKVNFGKPEFQFVPPTPHITQLGKANSATIKWNTAGNALVICSQIDADEAHRFYEGASYLHFCKLGRGVDKPLSHAVVTPETGPVHDVAWSPVLDEFAVSYGPMPPHITLNNGKTGQGKLSLGNTRRNTLRFNSHGSMLAIGGFGNLPGNLDIWSLTTKDCIASTEASCTVQLEWAPDGRMLIASTTTPRLRVDNSVRIFHYSGALRARIDFDVLYSVAWRPVPPGSFPERPITPGRCRGAAHGDAASAAAAASKPYRPGGSSGVLAEFMRSQRNAEKQSKATALRPGATVNPVPQTPEGPPGSKPKRKKKPNDTAGGP